MDSVGVKAFFDSGQFSKGVTEYVNGLNRANQATDAFGGKSGKGGAAGNAAFSIANLTKSFLKFAGAVGAVVGTIQAVRWALRGITNTISNLNNFIITAVGNVQSFQISLETLVAKELVASGAAKDFSDAMSDATPIADALLVKLRDIAVASPFDFRDIVPVFRTTAAFGLALNTSVDLTSAITNMAAAMGLSGDAIQRMAINMAQMNIVGKITARDVRDLSTTGVDLSAMLRSELGVTMDEFNEKVDEGVLSIRDFYDAFISYSGKNFAGAAERMSKTLTGLGAKFKELAFFGATDLFGASLGRLTETLGNIVDAFNILISSGTVARWGAILGAATDKVLDFVDSLLGLGNTSVDVSQMIQGGFYQTIEELGVTMADSGESGKQALANKMKEIIESSFEWGVNIVAQLAEGMIYAVSNILINAINAISKFLSGWLQPGSPPKVVQDIDKWGRGTMEAWLKGFTEADFSVLESIQSPLENAMSTLVSAGLLDSGEMASKFASISVELSKALSMDALAPSDSLLGMITQAGGMFGSQLAELTKRQFDLAKAINAVADAEERLSNLRKKEDESYDKMIGAINSYNAAVKGGAGEATLAGMRESFKNSRTQYRQAISQRKETEKELEAKKEAQEIEEKRVSLQEKLLQQLIKISKMQIQQQESVGDTLKPTAGGGGGGEGGGINIGGGGGFDFDFDSILDEIDEESIKAALDEAFSPLDGLSETFNIEFGKVKIAFDGLGTTIQEFKDDINEGLDKVDWEKFNSAIENIADPFGVFTGYWEDLSGILDSFNIEPIGVLGTTLSTLFDIFTTNSGTIIAILEFLAEPISYIDPYKRANEQLNGFATAISVISATITGLDFSLLTTFFDLVKEDFYNFGGGIMLRLKEGAEEKKADVSEGFSGIITAALKAVELILPDFKIFGNNIIQNIIDGTLEFENNSIDELILLLYRVHEKVLEVGWVEAFSTVGSAIINGIIKGLADGATKLYAKIKEIISISKKGAEDEAEISSPSALFARDIGKPIAEGIALGFGETAVSAMKNTMNKIMPEYQKQMSRLTSYGGTSVRRNTSLALDRQSMVQLARMINNGNNTNVINNNLSMTMNGVRNSVNPINSYYTLRALQAR